MIQSKSLVTFVMLAIAGSLVGPAVADRANEPAPKRHTDALPPTTPYAGWLGVQLAPVPAALASQLKLGENTGVMVRNVFKDSPADQAGLQRYDVIVQVDGQPVDRGLEMFSRHVQSKKPGDELKLSLYRGGTQSDVAVRVSETPPRLDERELKYEDDPDVAHRRMFGLRGKILRPGPNGWILDDLGELPNLPDFEGWFEAAPDVYVKGEPGSDEVQESRRVDAKGEVLHVRKNQDGTIEVSRYQAGSAPDKIQPKTYKDMDELRKADPEAAAMLSPATRPSEGGERTPGWGQRREELRKHQDSMRSYQDALRDYMRRYGDRPANPPAPPMAPKWREWEERIVPRPQAPMPPVRPLVPAPGRESQPEARFEVHPDGSISVTVDDGPNELNMTFPNEQAFQQKAPKLYDRYRDTVERLR